MVYTSYPQSNSAGRTTNFILLLDIGIRPICGLTELLTLESGQYFLLNNTSQALKTNLHRRTHLTMLPSLLALLLVTLSLQLYGAEAEQEEWKIINYWSEWCVPCREEIPMLNELSKQLSSSKVIVLGVNFDDDPRETTLEIAKAMSIEFPVLTLEEVAKLKLRAPDVLPTTYILSPTNEIVAKLIGQQTHEDLMEQLVVLGLLPFTDQESGH
ncbi:MAG: thiol-disulfide isomerase/thioredoxin [Rhodothermales bacterium]